VVQTPSIRDENVSIFNQYVIRVPRRDELREHLSANGIGTEVYYPCALHEQECFQKLAHRKGDFPEAERAAAETIALPIYPELSEEQITYVAENIIEFYNAERRP
jgi:dTDP-4-amino-4,6-dideoxygalactose transaminase